MFSDENTHEVKMSTLLNSSTQHCHGNYVDTAFNKFKNLFKRQFILNHLPRFQKWLCKSLTIASEEEILLKVSLKFDQIIIPV